MRHKPSREGKMKGELSLRVLGNMPSSYSICEKKYFGAFCGSRWRCMKSDKLPQVMSFESASVGAEDYKYENEKNL